jgi:hypothetical protein
MFYEYSINQWVGIVLYMIFMMALFAGIYLVSTMGANYLHKEDVKRNKLEQMKTNRRKKSDKKKYFIDVA